MVDTLYLKFCILLSNDFSLTSENEAYQEVFVSQLSCNGCQVNFNVSYTTWEENLYLKITAQ